LAGVTLAASIESILRDSGLPVVEVIDGLRRQLSRSDEAVLQAPPGAGKTTLVPLALLAEPWLAQRKIVMLEPRRLAARAAAARMAALLGESVGETVGYRMRLDTRVSSSTRIEVITEGILTRMLQRDPALEGVGLLVFDEFHERNLDADLGLALALHGREIYGDEGQRLKLLVMSATLDGAAMSALLGDAPLLTSAGKRFPVAVHYHPVPDRPGAALPAVAALIARLLQEPGASMLVFLPGRREIVTVARLLGERLDRQRAELPRGSVAVTDIAPLYGGLSLEQQQRAIEPPARGRRKVVLATNIAETSLTIEGVGIVVDLGLAREPVFDPGTGMTRLQTRPISQASSEQRRGRAGRLGPGECYRLWPESRQRQLPAQPTPEIHQADLVPLVLQLLAWGVDQPDNLAWLDPPPGAPFQQALDLLDRLGACKVSPGGVWQLTDHGERMATIPLHPRLAHMLLVAVDHDLQATACLVAALLSEHDWPGSREADLWRRWSALSPASKEAPALRRWRQRIQQQARQYRLLCPETVATPAISEHSALGLLVASAYPDRIARRRDGATAEYRLSNGRGAILREDDALVNATWLAVAELGGRVGDSRDQIFLAAELDPDLLAGALSGLVTEQEKVFWDNRSERILAERQQRVGALLLDSARLETPDPERRQRVWSTVIQRRGLEVLPWTQALRQWQARVLFLRAQVATSEGIPWPDVSDSALQASAQDWLLPMLVDIDSLAQLRRLDLKPLLMGLLSWPLPRWLDQLAPQRIVVPSGSSVPIDYCQPVPVLAVKLQEMFGADTTPAIVNGQVPLLLHLLSPAGRPLQLTRDLAGFWRSAYTEVKKDMKGRYPKHPWPEDPLAAVPTRHTKRRKS
jgi:ATP-dependent helicase HrpB